MTEPLPKPIAWIRTSPEDFCVEEIPLYEPCGQGDHLYITFRKRSLTTYAAVQHLAALLGVAARDAGTAGLKDRHAVTTQTASFPFSEKQSLPDPTDLNTAQIDILAMVRHSHKLRTGHLIGNRFKILLRGLDPLHIDRVQKELQTLAHTGLPNRFGDQRFGFMGDNTQRARAWLRGEIPPPRDRKIRRLQFSALQAELFHHLLDRRIENGTWNRVIPGDLVLRRNTCALFLYNGEPQDEEGALLATGPLYGAKMRWPGGAIEILERAVMGDFLGDYELLRRWAALGEGGRRPLQLLPTELTTTILAESTGSMQVAFVLPKGAYATSVLEAACDLRDASRRGPQERTLEHDTRRLEYGSDHEVEQNEESL